MDLADMMEMDLESAKAEGHLVPEALQNVGDALPAVGICACVLGVIITMGQIGGSPAALGASIGLALGPGGFVVPALRPRAADLDCRCIPGRGRDHQGRHSRLEEVAPDG